MLHVAAAFLGVKCLLGRQVTRALIEESVESVGAAGNRRPAVSENLEAACLSVGFESFKTAG
jgi:hypothetical protein